MYKKDSLDFHPIWQIGCTQKSAYNDVDWDLFWSDMLFIDFLRETGSMQHNIFICLTPFKFVKSFQYHSIKGFSLCDKLNKS